MESLARCNKAEGAAVLVNSLCNHSAKSNSFISCARYFIAPYGVRVVGVGANESGRNGERLGLFVGPPHKNSFVFIFLRVWEQKPPFSVAELRMWMQMQKRFWTTQPSVGHQCSQRSLPFP